jgi:hypothetical protein
MMWKDPNRMSIFVLSLGCSPCTLSVPQLQSENLPVDAQEATVKSNASGISSL